MESSKQAIKRPLVDFVVSVKSSWSGHVVPTAGGLSWQRATWRRHGNLVLFIVVKEWGRYRVFFIGNCSLFVAGLRSDVTIVTRKYEEEWGGRLGGGGGCDWHGASCRRRWWLLTT